MPRDHDLDATTDRDRARPTRVDFSRAYARIHMYARMRIPPHVLRTYQHMYECLQAYAYVSVDARVHVCVYLRVRTSVVHVRVCAREHTYTRARLFMRAYVRVRTYAP